MKTGRKFLKTAAIVLSLTSLSVFGLSSCSSKSASLSNTSKAAETIDVWSTYNTLKVMQGLHDYSRFDAELSAELVVGETEGAQLLYTSQKDVASFELIAGELKSGANVFNPENIEIYVQKYVNVVTKTQSQKNDAYPIGYTPDFLLPMSVAKEYGENSSKAGNNQGFYVEFTADENTVPGTYTGTFTLKTDNITQQIPVTVTVRNVVVAHSYGKSSFGLYQNVLLYGELDSTDEMYTKYYESLMRDYKTLLMHVPYALEKEKFADSVIKYYDEPQFISYGIPCFGGGVKEFDEAAFCDYVYEIAKRCQPDKIYLDKAYVYPLMADEPQDATKRKIMNQVTVARDALAEVIVERLDEDGFFDEYGGADGEFADAMRAALDGISCVITTDAVELFGEEVDTYCPPIQYFSTQYLRSLYQEHETNNSGKSWFYTCMQPLYPYPSHHTDDYLIGSRMMRWMQMAYGLEGYLYWNASYYIASTGGYVDCYTDPLRFGLYNGDGYLTYPGAKYDYDGFFPSLRLVAYRDGQEDYDLLCTYEELLQAAYGTALDVNEVLESSYRSLFTGTIYDPDDQKLVDERSLLMDRAEAISSETGLVSYITEKGSVKTLNVYAKSGSEIFVNGKQVSTESFSGGVKYTAKVTENVTVKAQKDGESASLSLAIGEQKTSATLDASSLQMSDTSTVTAGENGLEMVIRSKGSSIIDLNSFKPGFYVNASVFGGNVNQLKSIYFELDNKATEAYAIEIVLTMKDGTNVTLEKYMLTQGVNAINIENIPFYYDFTKKKADRLRVIFPNVKDDVLIEDREIVLRNFAYTLKGD